jgi:hypothetical protein
VAFIIKADCRLGPAFTEAFPVSAAKGLSRLRDLSSVALPGLVPLKMDVTSVDNIAYGLWKDVRSARQRFIVDDLSPHQARICDGAIGVFRQCFGVSCQR